MQSAQAGIWVRDLEADASQRRQVDRAPPTPDGRPLCVVMAARAARNDPLAWVADRSDTAPWTLPMRTAAALSLVNP
jgi:hypothetical protein